MPVVLIVDDHLNLAGAVSALVRSLGHKAVVAGGGEEALGVMRDHRADLVIMDVEMPDMSGLDVLRSLKKDGGGPPVIMFSGIDDSHDEALRLGAVACVLKTDPMRLVPLITQHLTRPLVPTR